MTRNPVKDGEQLSAVYWSGMVNAFNEESIMSGCTPSKGTGSWDVDVASGTVKVGTTSAVVNAQTKALTAPSNDTDLDSGEFRVDLVTADGTGTVNVSEGTAAAQPNAPTIPTSEVLIAAVFVDGSTTSLSPDDIKEYRIRYSPARQITAVDEAITFTESDVTVGLSNRNTVIDNGSIVLFYDYSGTSNDVSTEEIWPRDVEWDGTNWYIVGNDSDTVYQYDSTWTYTGTSYGVGTETGGPASLAWDGTNWWLLGVTNGTVYKYDSTWTYTGTSYDVSTEETTPRGIEWDGSNFWMTGADSDSVHQYDSTWTYTGTSYDVSTETSFPEDIKWGGTYFWLVSNGAVWQYDSSWNYTDKSFNLDSVNNDATGIDLKNGIFYVSQADTGAVDEYTDATDGSATIEWTKDSLHAGWDIASFQHTLAGETVTVDVQESTDGGSTWSTVFTDIPRGFDVSAIDPADDVRLRVNLSRANTANNPALDYAARRYIR